MNGPRDLPFDQLNWGLIATTDQRTAEMFARERGIEPKLILSRADLLRGPKKLRGTFRQAGLDAIAVHSRDWQRQRSPQLYELALAAVPARERLILDEADGRVYAVARAALLARTASLPAQIARAGGAISLEALRFARGRSSPPLLPISPTPASVLAIWPGSGSNVGGAISHISGILAAFRRAELRVGLVTAAEPPEQVLGAIDDVEICSPLPPYARMTGDTCEVIANGPIRKAASALAARLRPTFVYQRHCGFLFAGAELSRLWQVPLVLEWNGSEVWIRRNYSGRLPPERVLDRLAAKVERSTIASAALIAAVSKPAADMAVEAGAERSKTIVLPNGVDLEYVDGILDGCVTPSTKRSGYLIGWAGSFGPTTFGGDILLRAMSQLPDAVQLLMIGDGSDRDSCERLAAELGIADRVEFTGALPHADTLRRLSSCDALAAPYTPIPGQPFFGSPIKLFEYMAIRRPIITTRIGQIAALLADGRTARVVTPGDVQELSTAIRDVLYSPDRGQAMAAAARREVEVMHTWDNRAQAMLARLGISNDTRQEVRDAIG